MSARVALVTGAAGGIGAAIAARFASDGVRVALCDRAVDGTAKLAAQLDPEGRTARAYALDVTSRDDWGRVTAAVADELGAPTIVVNNAGITRDRTLAKMTDAEWDAVLDVHLRGTWLGCQHAVRSMKGRGGAIVNISSDGRHGAFGQANYAAAKAGIVALTRTVALEHARDGVRANVVAPGAVRTPMLDAVPEQVQAQWIAAIPLKRFALPAEIATVVAFLASQDASYVTGQVLDVNGGSSW